MPTSGRLEHSNAFIKRPEDRLTERAAPLLSRPSSRSTDRSVGRSACRQAGNRKEKSRKLRDVSIVLNSFESYRIVESYPEPRRLAASYSGSGHNTHDFEQGTGKKLAQSRVSFIFEAASRLPAAVPPAGHQDSSHRRQLWCSVANADAVEGRCGQ